MSAGSKDRGSRPLKRSWTDRMQREDAAESLIGDGVGPDGGGMARERGRARGPGQGRAG